MVYVITVIRLRNETILDIYPVRGNDFVRNNWKPAMSYEFNESLYLVYCGLESIVTMDSVYVNEVQNKLDSTCLKHGINYNPNTTYDEPPLFTKVQNDSLVSYETGRSKEFYMIFNGVKEIKSSFSPPTIR